MTAVAIPQALPLRGRAVAFESGTYRVELAQSALAKAARLARVRAPLETGGMLLGDVVDGVAHVRALTGPGRRAQRERFGLVQDYGHDTRLVHRVWPRLACFGSWHTHPGGLPVLSAMDREALRSDLSPGHPWSLELVLAGEPDMRSGLQVGLFTAFLDEEGVRPMACVGGAA